MPTKSGKSKYYWSVCVLLMIIMYTMISLHMSYILRHNLVNMMKSVGIAISGFGASFKVRSKKNLHIIIYTKENQKNILYVYINAL